MSITFFGLLDYHYRCPTNHPEIIQSVLCGFETDRFGIVQVNLTLNRENETQKMTTPTDEPDLEMFTKKEQMEMWKWCLILARVVFDVPAATDRFE